MPRRIKLHYVKTRPPISRGRLSKRISRLEKGYGKELKTHDTDNSASVGTTGTFAPLTQIAQGDTSITREGLQLRPRHIEWKLLVTVHASAAQSTWRCIIFCDREQQGTTPTAAHILEADTVAAWPEHDTRPRFKILRDFVGVLSNDGGKEITFRKGIIRFGKRMKIWYSGTTAAEASNGKNNLFAYFVSSEATNKPTIRLLTRLRYVD